MIRLAIAGALGRTGGRVLELAANDHRFEIVAALTSIGSADAGTSIRAGKKDYIVTDRIDNRCDVLIDFTSPMGTLHWLHESRQRKIPMVIGTTGLSEMNWRQIHDSSKEIPVLYAANFSLGVEVLRRALAALVNQLGPDYDIEIVESHHKKKVDAPSGTAMLLANEIKAAMAATGSAQFIFGRHGHSGPRAKGQVGIHAVRMGDVVGQHEIHFGGPGETITLKHTAHSRDTFAAGALRAAEWIVSKPAGMYSIRDVIG